MILNKIINFLTFFGRKHQGQVFLRCVPNVNFILSGYSLVSITVFSAGGHPGSRITESSTDIVEGVGMYLFGIYHVVIIIVLINMLIAMMSHSFEAIQVFTVKPVLSGHLQIDKTMV